MREYAIDGAVLVPRFPDDDDATIGQPGDGWIVLGLRGRRVDLEFRADGAAGGIVTLREYTVDGTVLVE